MQSKNSSVNPSVNTSENKSENPVNNSDFNAESENAANNAGINSENTINSICPSTSSASGKAKQAPAQLEAPSNPIPDLKLKDFKWVPVLLGCYYLVGYFFLVLLDPLLSLGEKEREFAPVAWLFLMFIFPGFLALFYFRHGTTFKQLLLLIFVGVPLVIFVVIAVVGLADAFFSRSSIFDVIIWPLINLALFAPLLLFRVNKAVGSNPPFLFLFSHLIAPSSIFLIMYLLLQLPGS